MAVPEEAAPAVESEQQPETCADLAQVTETLGTQTPPLKDPETAALTGSPTTNSGYAEAASCPETEEGEDEKVMRAASLRALSPSPEFQSVGSTPSPERVIEADSQPGSGKQDPTGTSSSAGEEKRTYMKPLLRHHPLRRRERKVLEHRPELYPQSMSRSCK